MANLSIGASSATSLYPSTQNTSANDNVPPMHEAIFSTPAQAIQQEISAYAAHGITVSEGYAKYLCNFGISNPEGGMSLSPEEWENKNSAKTKSSNAADKNILINSLNTANADQIKQTLAKSSPIELMKSKLDILYSQFS
jgi:hypothetical protein